MGREYKEIVNKIADVIEPYIARQYGLHIPENLERLQNMLESGVAILEALEPYLTGHDKGDIHEALSEAEVTHGAHYLDVGYDVFKEIIKRIDNE